MLEIKFIYIEIIMNIRRKHNEKNNKLITNSSKRVNRAWNTVPKIQRTIINNLLVISCLLINIFLSSCSFQMRFFQEMNKENIKQNLTISPLSVYQVLGLTAIGAKGNTLNQMLNALGNTNLEELKK